MTDEDKKRIVSEPPPPTDEIDGEWEGGDDEQTLIRDVPEGVSKSQPAPASAAVSGTAVAPISVPPKAAEASTPPEMKAAARVESDDEEEDDEEDEDEDEAPVENEDDEEEDEEDEEEDDEAHEPAVASPAADWLPEWAPYAVLAGLVGASIVFGLGLVGGGSAAAGEEDEKPAVPAASAAKKAPVKPSSHP
jgi:hypothetical protein